MRRHPCRGTISLHEVYIPPPLSHWSIGFCCKHLRSRVIRGDRSAHCSSVLFTYAKLILLLRRVTRRWFTMLVVDHECRDEEAGSFIGVMKQNISSEQIFSTTIRKLIQQNIFLHNFGRKKFRVENYWKNVTFSKWQKVNNILHAVPFFWPSVRVPASKWGGGSWFCRSILKR